MKKPAHFLATVSIGNKRKSNPKILRIILSDQYTRIDFGYVAPWIYDKGGWIDISKDTYLKVEGLRTKYPLKDAKNIPIAPNKLNFESIEDWQIFSLLFAPIPIKKCTIDVIEKDEPDKDNFNFYGIVLTEVKTKILE